MPDDEINDKPTSESPDFGGMFGRILQNPGNHLEAMREEALKAEAQRRTGLVKASADVSLAELVRAGHNYVFTPNDFRPGDVLEWKEGLKDKVLPAEGMHLVFLRFISEAERLQLSVADERAGTRDCLDCECLVPLSPSKFGVYLYDSHRLQRSQ